MVRVGGLVLPDPEEMLRREVMAEVERLEGLHGYTAQCLFCPGCGATFQTLRAYKQHIHMDERR